MAVPQPSSGADPASALSRVITEVVAPGAADVDRGPMFPREALGALADAGLLALPGGQAGGDDRPTLTGGARVVAELARHCAATATVVMSHYAAGALLHDHAAQAVRDNVAAGELATLAVFGPGGPWAPAGAASHYVGGVRIDGSTAGVVSAGQADLYIWATGPLRASGTSSLWLLSDGTPGLRVTGAYDAIGLRGAAVAPMTSQSVTVPAETMVGPNGGGLDVLGGTALPWLLAGTGALLAGIIDAVVDGAVAHLTGGAATGATEAPAGPGDGAIAAVGRMAAWAASARAAVDVAAAAWDAGSPDGLRRAAEARLAADEAARRVGDLTLDACGEAAVRTGLALERHLRDLRTAVALAPGAPALAALAGRLAAGLDPFG